MPLGCELVAFAGRKCGSGVVDVRVPTIPQQQEIIELHGRFEVRNSDSTATIVTALNDKFYQVKNRPRV